MSRLKKKLAALHQPRPRDVPELPTERAAPFCSERAAPSCSEGAAPPAPDAFAGSDARAEAPRARTMPEASERTAPHHREPAAPVHAPAPAQMPRKVVLGADKPLRASDLTAWRTRRAEVGAAPPQRVPPRAPATAELSDAPPRRAAATRDACAPTAHRHLSQLFAGWTWYASPQASVFVARQATAGDTPVGNHVLRDALTASPDTLGALIDRPTLDPRGLLFFDLETTGLSARGGDIAFLTGLARWSDDTLVTEVISLHDPSEERIALEATLQWLTSADAVVTYNGASFDLPFLRTRLQAHGLPTDATELPHIDLRKLVRQTHPERKGKGVNRLPQLEADLLGLVRTDDVPGSEAPGRWRDYLATHDARTIAPLVEHNLVDVCTLPLLLTHLLPPNSTRAASLRGRAKGSAKSPTPPNTPDTPNSTRAASLRGRAEGSAPYPMLAKARQRVDSGDLPAAIALYEAAVDAGLDLRGTWRAQRALAELLERTDQTDRAIATYEAMVANTHADPHPHVRLEALYREAGDFTRADEHATKARRLAPWKD